MRFLHTSDWHAGKTVGERSRAAELAAVLDEVVGIAKEERVDAMLVAGDLYEHRSPSPEAEETVLGALARLYEARIPVVAIPGNHDNERRLGAIGGALRPLGIHIVPRVGPPATGTVVEIASRDGSEAMLVACVPFVPERKFGDAKALFDSTESWHQAYAEGLADLFAAMAQAFRDDRVNVLMAHVFTDGALLGGGERDLSLGLGQTYAVAPSRLPPTAQYVALGHLHRPQAVRGSPAPARFSGSPLQLDFSETAHDKSVCVVEASPGRPASVREVAIRGGRRLLDLEGTLDDLRSKAASVGDAYLRVTVRTDGPVPGIADEVRAFLPNALQVRPKYERAEEVDVATGVLKLRRREQFAAYYRRKHGAAPEDALVAAFAEVLAAEEGAA